MKELSENKNSETVFSFVRGIKKGGIKSETTVTASFLVKSAIHEFSERWLKPYGS